MAPTDGFRSITPSNDRFQRRDRTPLLAELRHSEKTGFDCGFNRSTQRIVEIVERPFRATDRPFPFHRTQGSAF
jgi:hypothetical protein